MDIEITHPTHNIAIYAFAAGYLAQALATETGRPYRELLAEAKAAALESLKGDAEREGEVA